MALLSNPGKGASARDARHKEKVWGKPSARDAHPQNRRGESHVHVMLSVQNTVYECHLHVMLSVQNTRGKSYQHVMLTVQKKVGKSYRHVMHAACRVNILLNISNALSFRVRMRTSFGGSCPQKQALNLMLISHSMHVLPFDTDAFFLGRG